MPLVAGHRLGPYAIVSPLGAGGMGEVYRAHDSRLNRDVAIKVLPAGTDVNPDRQARFEQEARAAAALNHPNIVAVFDVGFFEGAPYIVSELLEGATLAERLREGPLPVRKATEYAEQIARGLAAAHDKGIVHRDLKPANVFITPDGRAKILDFGLAKLIGPTVVGPPEGGPHGATAMPTTPMGTTPGIVFGTVGYMAPEQVRGQAIDHRADLFAFGVLLYEMVTGARAFERETAPETLTAILKEDVPDQPLEMRKTPPGLTRIIRRCIEKDPAARFQSALDLAFALEAMAMGSSGAVSGTAAAASGAMTPVATRRTISRREGVAWTVALLALIAAAALVLRPASRNVISDARPIRFLLSAPPAPGIASTAIPAVAPDGRRVAFVGGGRVWVHSLDQLEPRTVGSRGGDRALFWSPDGETLVFNGSNTLVAVSASGSGSGRTLCELPSPYMRGGTWNADGVIVVGSLDGGLVRCSANGGPSTRLTQLNAERQDSGHLGPAFLPDGNRLLYWAQPSRSIWLAALDGGPPRELLTADSVARYVDPGYLVFARQGTLLAQPFDASTGTLSGEAVPIVERVLTDQSLLLGSAFDVSRSGVLTYRSGSVREPSQLTWVDRAGRVLATVGQPGLYSNPNLSPDGTRVAVERADAPGGTHDVWIMDLAREVLTRFTRDARDDTRPVWSPDGEWIAFASDRDGADNVYRKRANGAGSEELVLKTEAIVPSGWAPDGKSLLYQRGQVPFGLGILSMTGTPTARLLDPGRAQIIDRWGDLSRDGRWLAFGSDESGLYQVFVQSFPSSDGGKWQVSKDGGGYPRWAPSGRELFYLAGGTLMSVPIRGEAPLEIGAPQALFAARIFGTTYAGGREHQYAVAPDGHRFLINAPAGDNSISPITVVLNWQSLLKR